METRTVSEMNPHQFDYLDPTAFETYFGGIDRKLATSIYVKTANLFLKNIPERLKTLTEALTSYDNQGAIVVAHQIKGSLLSLGGNSLGQSFRQIEMSVNLTPNNELLNTLETLKPKIDLFVIELKNWIGVLEAEQAARG